METTPLRIEGHEVFNKFTFDTNGSAIIEEIKMEGTAPGSRTLKAVVDKVVDIDPSYEYTITIETSDDSESYSDSKKVLLNKLAVFSVRCFDTFTNFKTSITGPAGKEASGILYY